jgi:hypothetical protein
MGVADTPIHMLCLLICDVVVRDTRIDVTNITRMNTEMRLMEFNTHTTPGDKGFTVTNAYASDSTMILMVRVCMNEGEVWIDRLVSAMMLRMMNVKSSEYERLIRHSYPGIGSPHRHSEECERAPAYRDGRQDFDIQ